MQLVAAWKLLVADREVTCNWGECENEPVANRWLTCNLRVSVKMRLLQVDKKLTTGGHQKQNLSCKSINNLQLVDAWKLLVADHEVTCNWGKSCQNKIKEKAKILVASR